MSWPQVTLGEVADIVSGSTPKSSVPELWDGGILWATPTDLSGLGTKHISSTARTISERGLNSCSARLLPKNSVLFSSRAPIGLVAINTEPMATNQGFKSFVPSEDVDPDYLYWWLRANKQRLQDLGNGATFKEVSKSVVSRVDFPLPPLKEQRRIAAILDKADAIRRKREQALALADDLLKSTFSEMFFGPVCDWPVVPLRSIASLINGDRSSRYPSGKDVVGSGVLFLNTKNIDESKLSYENCAFITQDKFNSLTRGKLQRNDLVITLRGSIGQCAIFNAEYETGFINAQLMIIRPSEAVLPRFLHRLLLHPIIQTKLMNEKSGSAVPQLTGKQIGDLEIPLPDKSAQRAYCDIVLAAEKAEQTLNLSQEEAEQFFASLSQRAFRGEL